MSMEQSPDRDSFLKGAGVPAFGRAIEGAAARSHADEVAELAGTIKERAAAGLPVRITEGTSAGKEARPPGPIIDIGRLRAVLSIDPAARVATVEPSVTFGELSRETLRYGLLPAVMPTRSAATIGGAIAGFSAGSTSHRYGGLHDTCIAFEVVTGEGEVVTLAPEQDPLLFAMIHGSRGTLGVLTKASLRLVRAKPLVRVEYIRYSSFERLSAEVKEQIASGQGEHIEVLVLGPRSFVLCVGRGVDAGPRAGGSRWPGRFHERAAVKSEDYLLAQAYCSRFDSAGEWIAGRRSKLASTWLRELVRQTALESPKLGRLYRGLMPLFGRALGAEVDCEALVPFRRAAELEAWCEGALDIYPLWVAPYRMAPPYPWIAPGQAANIGEELLFYFALRGRSDAGSSLELADRIERKVIELGGVMAPPSRCYAAPDRFWSVHNRRSYESAKRRLDPDNTFGGLFEACRCTDGGLPEDDWIAAESPENRVSGVRSRGVRVVQR